MKASKSILGTNPSGFGCRVFEDCLRHDTPAVALPAVTHAQDYDTPSTTARSQLRNTAGPGGVVEIPGEIGGLPVTASELRPLQNKRAY